MTQGLARKLRVLRLERGWSVRDAARELGISKETVSLLERGLRDPHPLTLSKIARGFGVPVEELLELEEEAAPKAPAREAGQPETTEKALTVLWQGLATRARMLRERYQQKAFYEDFLEELAMLSRDHEQLERLRKARLGGPRAYFREPDELADAIEDVFAEEEAISQMIEEDLEAPTPETQRRRRRMLFRTAEQRDRGVAFLDDHRRRRAAG